MQTSSVYLLFIWLSFFYGSGTANPNQDPPIRGDEFRVAAFNIRYNAEADEKSGNGWGLRKRPVAKVILDHRFDIVGTQEGDAQQLEDLKALLPGYEYLGHPYGGQGDLHNAATFYKNSLFEVLDSGVFWFSETPDEPSVGWDASDRRIAHWTKFQVKATGKTFFFFNVHFYWRLEEARKQSGPLLIRKIKEIAQDEPVICVGDFNSTEETAQIQAIKSFLGDAYEQTQSPREGVEHTNLGGGVFQGEPKNRIDYVFVSSQIQVTDYKVLSDQYDGGRYPSDHLPVTSLIRLPAE